METFPFHLIHIVGQNSGKIWWINSFIFSINSSRRYCCTWSLYDHDVRFTKFLPWSFSIHRLFGCRSLRSTIFGLPTVSVTSEGSCCYLNTVYFLKIKNISSDNVLYRCLKSLWGFWLFPQNNTTFCSLTFVIKVIFHNTECWLQRRDSNSKTRDDTNWSWCHLRLCVLSVSWNPRHNRRLWHQSRISHLNSSFRPQLTITCRFWTYTCVMCSHTWPSRGWLGLSVLHKDTSMFLSEGGGRLLSFPTWSVDKNQQLPRHMLTSVTAWHYSFFFFLHCLTFPELLCSPILMSCPSVRLKTI